MEYSSVGSLFAYLQSHFYRTVFTTARALRLVHRLLYPHRHRHSSPLVVVSDVRALDMDGRAVVGVLPSWGSSSIVDSWGGSGVADSWGGSGVAIDGSSMSNGLVGDGSGDGLDGYGSGDGLDGNGVDALALVDDGVETMVVIGGVVDGTFAAVGLDEGVTALDYVTVAGLVVGLDVAGVGVVDTVAVAVLGVGVVLGLNDLGVQGERSSVGVSQRGGMDGPRSGGIRLVVSHWQKTGVGDGGHEGGEDDEL